MLASQGSQVSVAQRSGTQQGSPGQLQSRAVQASRAEGRVSGTMMGRGQLITSDSRTSLVQTTVLPGADTGTTEGTSD